jgi:L-2-hydroxyglutarate oxidase
VKGLVYPVPDPRYPFLGVHLTPRVDGEVLIGPNAVLALAREGYRRRDVSPADLREIVAAAGFRRFARTHLRTGVREVAGSLSKRRFVAAARRYRRS